MVDRASRPGPSASPLVGLLILASVSAGRLVGRIVGTAGELAIIEALEGSDLRGPGLLLLRLGSMALPDGSCRLFRTREELDQALALAAPARRRGPPGQPTRPMLVVMESRSADSAVQLSDTSGIG